MGQDATSRVRHFCVTCGKQFGIGFHTFCDSCGSMVDVDYDITQLELSGSAGTLQTFAPLLPLEDSAVLARTPLPETPCVHARKLGQRVGLSNLYLKDESALPTRSTKDRMAAVALPYLVQGGVTRFCTSSTGNSSTALAHALEHTAGMQMVLFTAESFVHRVNLGSSAHVTQFALRDATFVEAYSAAGAFAASRAVTPERGFFNPARREGLKLCFLEATRQVPTPIDWYVQAVSSGMGVYGTANGAAQLKRLGLISRTPRLLCVQQATCCPMVSAFRAEADHVRPEDIVARPTGIAEAILRGDPSRAYPNLRRRVLESQGDFVSVTEAEIRDARALVEELEGLHPCFNAATAVAGVLSLAKAGKLDRDATVLINLSGGERRHVPAPDRTFWLTRSPSADIGWVPEDARARHAWETAAQ